MNDQDKINALGALAAIELEKSFRKSMVAILAGEDRNEVFASALRVALVGWSATIGESDDDIRRKLEDAIDFCSDASAAIRADLGVGNGGAN